MDLMNWKNIYELNKFSNDELHHHNRTRSTSENQK